MKFMENVFIGTKNGFSTKNLKFESFFFKKNAFFGVSEHFPQNISFGAITPLHFLRKTFMLGSGYVAGTSMNIPA